MRTSVPTIAVSEREREELRLAFDQARRSCDIEGLPPPSAFAHSVGELVIAGTVTFSEAVEMLVRYHKAGH